MKTKNLALCALFAALMALCAWICIPIGNMTFTFQTFAVFLTLLLLGGKWGTVAVLVYLLLGAVGLPVFSGFRGSLGMLFGATGGYIFGFLACSLCYWLITAVFGTGKIVTFLALLAGLLLCYACGTAWMLGMYAGGGLWEVLLICVVPYLLPDGIKLALAWFLEKRLRPMLK